MKSFQCSIYALTMILCSGCNDSNTTLEIPVQRLQLGLLYNDSNYMLALPIKNRSQQPLKCSLSATCTCTDVSPNVLSINPGEVKWVHATLDLTRVRRSSPDKMGFQNFTTGISAVLADGKSLIWQLRGQVRSLFVTTQHDLNIGTEPFESAKTKEYKLALTSVTPLKEVKQYPGKVTGWDSLQIHQQDGQDFIISFRLPQPIKVGLISRRLELQGETHSGLKGRANILVHGRIVGDVTAFPEEIHCGSVTTGSEISETIEFISSKKMPFTITPIVASGSKNKTVTVEQIAPNSGKILYRVKIPAASAGNILETVEFEVAESISSNYVIEIPIAYYGATSFIDTPSHKVAPTASSEIQSSAR